MPKPNRAAFSGAWPSVAPAERPVSPNGVAVPFAPELEEPVAYDITDAANTKRCGRMFKAKGRHAK